MKPAIWKADGRGNLWILRHPGPLVWGADSSFSFSDEFVDRLIREGEAAG